MPDPPAASPGAAAGGPFLGARPQGGRSPGAEPTCRSHRPASEHSGRYPLRSMPRQVVVIVSPLGVG